LAMGGACGSRTVRFQQETAVSYIGNSLAEGEHVLYVTRISLRLFWLRMVAVAAVSLGLVFVLRLPAPVMAAVPVLYAPAASAALVRRRCSEISLTNIRVVVRTGLLSKDTHEIAVRKIESVDVRQGLAGRFFDFGEFEVRGTGQGVIEVPAVNDPMVFLRAVNGLLAFE